MNFLKAVFWDYPQFTEKDVLKSILEAKRNTPFYFWIMGRFLEYGRAVDALDYFRIEEITENLPRLRLTPYSIKKWKRLTQVYVLH